MFNRDKVVRSQATTSASDVIKETMDDFGITQDDLAKRIGINQKHLSEILNRQTYMSVEIAVNIEKVMGISSRLLLNMDINYRLDNLKVPKKDKFKNPLFLKRYDWATAH
ncbi:MAG: HigA family addiction module antidote protein [Bacteroides sp.]|nr:HigA family addiction module antidote protein [Bacteroides sp.]